MQNPAESILRKQLFEHRAISNIDTGKLKIGIRQQSIESRLFERDIIVVVEVINADHIKAALTQSDRVRITRGLP